ncbi:MAG: hypothetical protein HYU55_13755 [Nocardioides sp.]|nr:hypothetical protein [Nocardioides sp.]
MTSRTSAPTSGRTSTWAGIAIGVIALGLLALFAIALPKAVGEDDGAARLVLPDTLPGGYAAADDPASFEGGDYADQADSIAEQEKSNSAYGNRVLPEVLGHAAATRTYVLDGTKAVFVQVFDAEGGAFAPNSSRGRPTPARPTRSSASARSPGTDAPSRSGRRTSTPRISSPPRTVCSTTSRAPEDPAEGPGQDQYTTTVSPTRTCP